MKASTLAHYFEKLEKTPSRNQMVVILAELFSKVKIDEIGKLSYFVQGRLAPLYSSIEFGMADKMMIKAISQSFAVEEKRVSKLSREKGDLGLVAEELKKSQKSKIKSHQSEMDIGVVYDALVSVARASGMGSQERKINAMANLLKNLDPLSVRYIVRIPLGKLRIGFSDMTVLDGLSWMLDGTKRHRKEIERAYNVRPDLGFIAKEVKEKGIEALSDITPELGTPIRMAQAERMSSAKEILKKIGKCAVEPKIDGFRLQCHFVANTRHETQNTKQISNSNDQNSKQEWQIKLFSRNLEDATFMYPDVVKGIKSQVKSKEAIFEGEAVAYNVQTGEYLPFQETVQRKRKYGIAKMAEEVPLKLICFDLLYLDGKNFLHQPYWKRRAKLEKLIKDGDVLLIAQEQVVEEEEKLEQIFEDAVSRGLEGVMAKRLKATYQAGVRNWNWIKYKRSYAGKLSDTIDALVMGYDYGKGKRTKFGIGAFLVGVYDQKEDVFRTIAKIGTGLTDDEWLEIKKRCERIVCRKKPSRYVVDKQMNVNIWVEPEIVVEVRADEITRSPVHTAGRKMGPSKSGTAEKVKTAGYALRFPRLERFRDKRPEDATTLKEIWKMYKMQRSK